jgi:DNA-binding MarR family transcriptional regulator
MVRNRTTVKAQPGLLLQPFVVFHLGAALIDGVIEGSEVVGAEYAVASWLGAGGGATPTELARELGLAPTTLSAIIDRLVRKKQVRRVSHPEDGRSYVLELTAAGRATNRRNSERFARMRERLLANLEDDPEVVLALLRRYEEALRKTIAGS